MRAMDVLGLVQINILSPVVLAFALGILAVLVRSDLKFPEGLDTVLSIYLLLAIGLKGGMELSRTPLAEFWKPCLATLLLGLLIPILCYAVLRGPGRFSVADAAAIAAHYGSVSAVTFTAALAFLDGALVRYEGFLPALVAILEVPAIVVALLLARLRGGGTGSLGGALHEALAGKSVVLLLGGIAIGYLSGEAGFRQVAPLFSDLFRGALALFLLEMGMVAGRRLRDVRTAGAFLAGFGIVMPVVHGVLGVAAGWLAGLSPGGTTVLGVLAASASYIAAPAAVRIAIPAANPGYYLTASLAVTFPFNLVVGIPIYYAIATWIHGGPP
jgi:uncharacterized protein